MNGRLVAVFKILCFIVKERMAGWVQFSKFCISLYKANDRLGTPVKFCISPVKKTSGCLGARIIIDI